MNFQDSSSFSAPNFSGTFSTDPSKEKQLSRRKLVKFIAGATSATLLSSMVGTENFTQAFAAPLPPQTATVSSVRSPVFAANIAPQSNVVLTWNTTLLAAIVATKAAATVGARAIAIVHNCIYDAWAMYDHKAAGTRFGLFMKRPASENTFANKSEAISYAAYQALVNLFPSHTADFNAVMNSLGYDPTYTDKDHNSAAGLGNLCAYAILKSRVADGSNQLSDLEAGNPYCDCTGYVPVNTPDKINDPNSWQPLSVPDGKGGFTVQIYTTPQWGLVTPFAMTKPSQFLPSVGPARYPSPAYTLQANQLINISANLTDEQKVIAEYWADNSGTVLPPGHWCNIAQYVSNRDKHTLDDDVKLFFALSGAMLDASIACWDAKRHYNSVRPITAIHFLYKGKKIRAWAGPGLGTAEINGEDWQPYQAANVVTPAFPEFVSGHSTFSAAAATILRNFTGSDRFGASYTQHAGTSVFEPGVTPHKDVTLHWATFTDAANQAGMSRLYGGIHFWDGNIGGRLIGQQVGALVWQKAQAYIQGKLS